MQRITTSAASLPRAVGRLPVQASTGTKHTTRLHNRFRNVPQMPCSCGSNSGFTTKAAPLPVASCPSTLRKASSFGWVRTKSTSNDDPAKTSTEETSSNPAIAAPGTDDRFAGTATEELLQAPQNGNNRQAIGKVERRLSITFTCTVPSCGHRSSHEFSRQAYEKGIVLCQCPQCESRHLIADHLGWFDSDDLTQGGKYKTIEALLASKGERVARAVVRPDGTVEVEKTEGQQ